MARQRDGVDLRTKEVIDTLAAGAIGPFIGGMLVGPCRVTAVGFYHLKDSVDAEIFVRIDGRASTTGIAGQEIRVDGSIELGEVGVDGFVELGDGADLAWARTAGCADIRNVRRGLSRRRELAVIGDVVPEAGSRRRTAGNQSGKSREGVGWLGGGSVVEGNAVRTQLRKGRLRMAADIVGKVESVQAVDADQQNVLDPVARMVVLCLRRR